MLLGIRDGGVHLVYLLDLMQCADGTCDYALSAADAVSVGKSAAEAEAVKAQVSADAALADLIETQNARADFKRFHANAKARDLARRLQKPASGGSDAHSRHEVGNALTVADCAGRTLEDIKAALLAGRTRPQLIRSTPRLRKALSQLKKCRRTHASPARLLKAVLYFPYCLLLDVKSLFAKREK